MDRGRRNRMRCPASQTQSQSLLAIAQLILPYTRGSSLWGKALWYGELAGHNAPMMSMVWNLLSWRIMPSILFSTDAEH